MKTQVEITPEMEPRLDKLEAELRKDLDGKVVEGRIAPLVEHMGFLAEHYREGQHLKAEFGERKAVTRQLKDALKTNHAHQRALAHPAVQKEITYEAIRRTTPALKGLIRDAQDKLITQSLKRLLAEGKGPAIYAQIEELKLQQLDIEAALARRGGRPTDELQAELALRVGAELASEGVALVTTQYGTFDSVVRDVFGAAGFGRAGDIRHLLEKAITTLKKREAS